MLMLSPVKHAQPGALQCFNRILIWLKAAIMIQSSLFTSIIAFFMF